MSNRRKAANRLQLEFECRNCGRKVYNTPLQLAHDHCPYCRWSRHIMFSYADEPPCFEPMRPGPAEPIKGHPAMTLNCIGCGFSYLAFPKHLTEADRPWTASIWRDLFPGGDRGSAIWEIVYKDDGAYFERDRIIHPAAKELVTA